MAGIQTVWGTALMANDIKLAIFEARCFQLQEHGNTEVHSMP